MNILNRHILKNLLYIFVASLLVLTFILVLGLMIKILSRLDTSISQLFILKMFLMLLPKVLAYAIPIASLVSVTLVFSRMSAENEITAMRASGISLWQIVNPAILLALASSGCLLYLNMFAVPHLEATRKSMMKGELLSNPSNFLRGGSTIELGKLTVNIGEKEADGTLKDLRVIELDHSKGIVANQLLAQKGRIIDANETSFTIEFIDVIILDNNWEFTDNKDDDKQILNGVKVTRLPNANTTYTFYTNEELNSGDLRKRAKYLNLWEMIARLAVLEKKEQSKTVRREHTDLLYNLNKNLALAFSPLAFLLMALPFGLRSSRSETSIGLLISLIVMMVYYATILLTGAFDKHTALHPEILVWLPNIIFQSLGLGMIAFKVSH
ncbi:LptF/LptG family permease [Lentisphaera profundi]|uniref:LptF/LptG family permease n=1 Tax=Lentisphaera profundi TaxID=1658616 RepID=A0ABY7VPN4_9BACT|nr:LptF/LptG family permease [Lentisphaera profundi]WDE96125.1 LptF/LptG family permease [Lentisphaera profundi]